MYTERLLYLSLGYRNDYIRKKGTSEVARGKAHDFHLQDNEKPKRFKLFLSKHFRPLWNLYTESGRGRGGGRELGDRELGGGRV